MRLNASGNNISTPAINIGTIAVGLGICIMILTISVIRGFKGNISEKLKSLTSDAVIMPYQSTEDITGMPLKVSNDTLDLIKKINIIESVQPVCIKNGILKIKEENEGIVFKAVGKEYNWGVLRDYLIEGVFPNYTDSLSRKDILISKKLADKMHIRLHQKIIIYFIIKDKNDAGEEKISYRSRDFKVCGIIHPQMGELDNQLIFGNAEIIQKVNGWSKDEYSQIELYCKKNIKIDEIVERLINILPYNYQILSAEELYPNIFNWLEMIDVNAVIIISLMLIVAATNMVSALIILILEKVQWIGILKALGMKNLSIKNIFLMISLKILGLGLFWGNALALLIIFLQRHFHVFTLNPDAYYVSYIPMEWDVKDWLLLNAGTVLTCLIVMFLPTYIISKMSPAQILRWE